MSIRITSAQIVPNPASTGQGCLISIGIEEYGVLKESSGAVLYDSGGAELHTADKQDHTIPDAGAQIAEAIGGLLSWLSTP